MKPAYLFLFSWITSSCAYAQNAAVAVPGMGFAFDSSQSAIRPLHGIPGAALLGAPLDLGFPVVSAVIAPRQDFAIAVLSAESPRVVPLSGNGSASSLTGAMAAPDRVVFSPSGGAAVLVSNQDSGRMQVVAGLPGNPVVEEIDISTLATPFGAIAVSDDGQTLLIAEASDNHMWLFNSSRTKQIVPLAGLGTVLAFRGNSHDAAAMLQTGDLYLLQNLDQAPALSSVLPGGDLTARPVGLWVSPNGNRAYSASSNGNIAAVDLASGTPQSISCQCSPTGIQPLRSELFRLTDVSGRPVMVLDASASTPRVWFVPAASQDVNGGAQ
jgi:hypothetical protein